jgi:hypothetical protein
MNPNGQQQSGGLRPEDAFGLLYNLANTHKSAIAVMLRRDFGSEALSWNAFFAMILIFMCYAITADKGMLAYLGIWFVCQVMQRARTARLLSGGAVIHSRYAGYPYMAMQMPFVRSLSTATGFVEPMMCLVGGAMLCSVSQALGVFIMIGFMSFIVCNGIEKEIRRKRLERMRDAEIEQRWYSHAHKYGTDD